MTEDRPYGLYAPITPRESDHGEMWFGRCVSQLAANSTVIQTTHPQLWSLERALDVWARIGPHPDPYHHEESHG